MTNKTKKFLSLMLAVIVLCAAIITSPITTLAAETNSQNAVFIEGDYKYTINDDGTATIIEYTGIAIEVTIPSQLGGYSVTRIGGLAFDGCYDITHIIIPDSVKTIKYNAFIDCTSLTDIEIPNSVTEIGWGAFSGCTSLKSINLPDSVTYIGYDAFNNCISLTDIEIPNSVTEIYSGVFSAVQA